MKKTEAFARKRKTRDKANLRWVKNRHLVIPALGGVALLGGFAGATVAMSINSGLIAHGFIAGAVLAYGVAGWRVVKDLCE